MVGTHGYLGAPFARTFDTYDHTDCYNFMDIHDHLKLIKHGYSKVTDHASREIRHNRLSRAQALALVQQYESKPMQYTEKFCDWLGVDRRALGFIMDQHRNPKFWDEVSPGVWTSKKTAEKTEQPQDPGFASSSALELGGNAAYITIGKGWP